MIEAFWLLPTFIAGMALGTGVYHRRLRDRAYIEGRAAGKAEYERLIEAARKCRQVSEEGSREIVRLRKEAMAECDRALVEVNAARQMMRVVR